MWRCGISRDPRAAIRSILPSCPSLLPKEDGNVCKSTVAASEHLTIEASLPSCFFSSNGMYSIGWMWLSGYADEVDMPRETVFKALSGRYASTAQHYRNR